MATTEPKQRTITLTNAAPVRIRDIDWPILSQSTWDDDADTLTWWLKVRQHADGRALVYGGRDHDSEPDVRGGELVETGGDIVGAIRRVAATVGAKECGDECIARLPAVEL